ncbi:MAG TPA: zinc ribbon domain-containing protein [Firmicutes bacterium]|nr:zinc ribbon domain-containing protein [Bacillota bacterium]
MSTFDDVFSKAKSVAETAGKKTGEMIEVARLKIQAGDMEREISSMLEGLGRLVYESRREGADAAGKMDDCCQKLDEKYEELAKARAKIDEYRNQITCKNCGAQNADDAVYCKRCGVKLSN